MFVRVASIFKLLRPGALDGRIVPSLYRRIIGMDWPQFLFCLSFLSSATSVSAKYDHGQQQQQQLQQR